MVGCVSGKAYRVGGISASTKRIGGISASIKRIGGISAFTSLICSINEGNYLRVIPTEPMWINVDISADYSVITNTEWMVR